MDPRKLPPLPILNPNDIPKRPAAAKPGSGSVFGLSPPPPQAPPPRSRPLSEKYGGLYYLGVGGLIAVVIGLTWFGWSAWSLRAIWRDVYQLHDPSLSEAERIAAAERLSLDPRTTQRQLWDIAFRRDLPTRARWLLTERLNAEAARPDPDGYAKAIAYSEGWPNWFRALLARPLASAAAQGIGLPAGPLEALSGHDDPFVRVFALHARAAGRFDDPQARQKLKEAASGDGPERAVAGSLLEALEGDAANREAKIADAARRLRTDHPDAVEVWREEHRNQDAAE